MPDKTTTIVNELAQQQTSIYQVSAQLRVIKEAGTTQKFFIEYLSDMRKKKLHERTDDWILEILDVAAGYCQEKV